MTEQKRRLSKRHTQCLADDMGMPMEVAAPAMIVYRSTGIGIFGVVGRWVGMPLEKIALFMNSSQVSGSGQLGQAIKLTFEKGVTAPWRVVGPASIVAWFLQYSVMGAAFQTFDALLSKALKCDTVYYGNDLMTPPSKAKAPTDDPTLPVRTVFKSLLAPACAGMLESFVANRAEVQRYYGIEKMAQIEGRLSWNALYRACAPGYFPNAMRNIVMCNTSFLVTPVRAPPARAAPLCRAATTPPPRRRAHRTSPHLTASPRRPLSQVLFKHFYPQERKSQQSLFWFGLGVNIFFGNIIAITQQALWGRSLDYCAVDGGRNINYGAVVRDGLRTDGIAAFFTFPKWATRVLMNAPVQGTLPWFYNQVLPRGEKPFLAVLKPALGVFGYK